MGVLPGDPALVALLVLAAVVIGFSKTALGGLGVVSVAIFASVLPARQSTAAILMVLLVGDVIACWHYRRDPDWRLIRRLLPAVVPGLLLGTLFLRVVSDDVLRRSIGAVLLVLLVLQLWVKARGRSEEGTTSTGRRARAWGAGSAMGFTTMTANAAGPGHDPVPVGLGHRQAPVRRDERVVLPHRQPLQGALLGGARPAPPEPTWRGPGCSRRPSSSARCSATPS